MSLGTYDFELVLMVAEKSQKASGSVNRMHYGCMVHCQRTKCVCFVCNVCVCVCLCVCVCVCDLCLNWSLFRLVGNV